MNPQTRMGWRFATAALLIAGTAIFLRGRGQDTPPPAHRDVTEFPREFGDWQAAKDLPLGVDALRVLGPGEFLDRLYSAGQQPSVDLLLEYFPSQRTGDTMHSPRHCLPGSGWEPVESTVLPLTRRDASPAGVNDYVIAKGEDRQVVLYWYQAHGRVVASEYQAKWYLVWDAMRLNRTDGSLVRVSTVVAPGENVAGATRRASAFAEQILGMLDKYIPS